MALWGIDISNHQAGADLSRAKVAGCSFVFIKATEGGTYRDPYFAGFQAQAHALDMPCGAYHFARPGNGRTGAQEAAFFLSVAGARLGELPPVLDLEDTKLSATETVAWALDFLSTVQKATGVRPIVYTYTAFAQAHLGAGAGLEAYPLWLANYRTSTTTLPPAPAPWGSWAAWQYTSTAQVPGIPGGCDRNITTLTVAELKALGAPVLATTEEVGLAADDVQKVNDYTKALLLDGYTVGGERKPALLDVLVETQRRVSRTEAALSALAKGLGPQVEAAVREALSTDYDATVQLTPKAGA